MKFKEIPTYTSGINKLEDALLILKQTSIPKEPYAAAKYLMLFAEQQLDKDGLNPQYRANLMKLVNAIQGITIYL